jgi:hypothetical protein
MMGKILVNEIPDWPSASEAAEVFIVMLYLSKFDSMRIMVRTFLIVFSYCDLSCSLIVLFVFRKQFAL